MKFQLFLLLHTQKSIKLQNFLMRLSKRFLTCGILEISKANCLFHSSFLLKLFGRDMDVSKIRSKKCGRNWKENPTPCVDIETEKSSSGTLKSSEKSTHQRCVFTTFFISELFHEFFKKSNADIYHWNIIRSQNVF